MKQKNIDIALIWLWIGAVILGVVMTLGGMG